MKKVINIKLPGSKSITQRALFLAALAATPSKLINASDCDDCKTMISALSQFNIIFEFKDNAICVKPNALKAPKKIIYCENCGVCARFISALALIVEGVITIDGDARMRERPIQPLINALATAGVEREYLENTGKMPYVLMNNGKINNYIEIDAGESSQFVSALALVGAKINGGLTIRTKNTIVSKGYISLTIDILRLFGVDAQINGEIITVPQTSFNGAELKVEPDLSLAPYFYVAADAMGAEIKIEDALTTSTQRDLVFNKYFNNIKLNSETSIDLNETPDLLPPLAAAALLHKKDVTIYNIKHARLKESDRIAVIARELKKIGAKIDEQEDGLTIHSSRLFGNTELNPEGDHRLAMLFGVISLFVNNLQIKEKKCVSKSFPKFWSELNKFQ